MTKQQSKITVATKKAALPAKTNLEQHMLSVPCKSANQGPKKASTKLLTVSSVDKAFADETFSSQTAKKFDCLLTERLVKARPSCGDTSSGFNSGTYAENKREITINQTKTPKLGVHMKNVLRSNLAKKS